MEPSLLMWEEHFILDVSILVAGSWCDATKWKKSVSIGDGSLHRLSKEVLFGPTDSNIPVNPSLSQLSWFMNLYSFVDFADLGTDGLLLV